MARRGAAQVPPTGASDAWWAAARARRVDHEARQREDDRDRKRLPDAEPWQPEEWIDEGEIRDEATGAVERSREGGAADTGAGVRGRRPSGPRRPAGDAAAGGGDRGAADIAGQLGRAVPSNRLPRFEARLRDATDSFKRERFEEARRVLRPLAEQAPGASSVRELYGLTLYRLGRWARAARELEAFRTQTGSTEQHPVLADCYRALGRYDEVEELWDELRAASPSAELVAEGRIVAAGALADQGRLDDAIRLLERASRPTRKPRLHHLRMAYALADLYERAGDLPRARELFARVAASDPSFVDVEARLRALR